MNPQLGAALIPLFLLGFSCLWCGVCCLLSLIGGWHTLSKTYRRQTVRDGKLFGFASMALGSTESPWRWFPVNYNGCLFIKVGDQGLDISILFPFRMLHPPLHIPWSAIESCSEQKLLFSKSVQVKLAAPRQQLNFGGPAGKAILERCRPAA